MKWTPEQIKELTELAKFGKSNAELAVHFGVERAEIHAARSRYNITRAKVAEMNAIIDGVTAIDQSKADFVENMGKFLQNFIAPEIEQCELLDNDTVLVRYINGVTRKVNIAADSRAAIMKDVINRAAVM